MKLTQLHTPSLLAFAAGALCLGGCIIATSNDEAGLATGADEATSSAGDGEDETGLDGTEGGDDEGLDGTEGEDEYERPHGAREIISDEDIERLLEIGAVIYPGNTPPAVADVYDVYGGVVTYHDRGGIVGTATCNYIWTLEGTDDPEFYIGSYESYGNCAGSGQGQGSWISGQDGCFTLYQKGAGERDGCEHEGVSIVSGCVADDGIEGMIAASLAGPRTSVQPNACETLIDGGLLGAEGERDLLDYPNVDRVGD